MFKVNFFYVDVIILYLVFTTSFFYLNLYFRDSYQ